MDYYFYIEWLHDCLWLVVRDFLLLLAVTSVQLVHHYLQSLMDQRLHEGVYFSLRYVVCYFNRFGVLVLLLLIFHRVRRLALQLSICSRIQNVQLNSFLGHDPVLLALALCHQLLVILFNKRQSNSFSFLALLLMPNYLY